MKWTFPNLRLFLSLAVITGGIYLWSLRWSA